ncbi:hypothetical protein [Mycobacterium uberis]|uniref:hypothetical protein n=1 Tax=Mycobacterium uberis TaxID=2162698 RepID=UPI000E304133|nr:hypothetical protein [Mycobacterium uberis]
MIANEPVNGIENVSELKKISFEQMAREVLARQGKAKIVVVDPRSSLLWDPAFREQHGYHMGVPACASRAGGHRRDEQSRS